jgi:hypothetical protein
VDGHRGLAHGRSAGEHHELSGTHL